MVRRLVIDCDPCSNDGRTNPGRIVDFVIRVTDPATSAQEPPETLRGTLEICPEHSEPVHTLEDLMKLHGSPLSDEAARLLALPPKPASGGPQNWSCHECKPPKTLRKGSLHSHCQTQHDKRPTEADVRPLSD